jgi:hypothetical protein
MHFRTEDGEGVDFLQSDPLVVHAMTIGVCPPETKPNGSPRASRMPDLEAAEVQRRGHRDEVEREVFRDWETDLDTRPEQIGDDLSYCQIALVLRVVSHLR